jgi:hypothetical protein
MRSLRLISPFSADPLAYPPWGPPRNSQTIAPRHLNETQRGVIATEMARLSRGANQHSAEHVGISTSSISQTAAAKLLNVSRDTVVNARVVLERGTPEEVASSDIARQRARCGGRGATIRLPSWGGLDVGMAPFPADRLAKLCAPRPHAPHLI